MERYERSDVLRILRITARQLSGWEKAGLLAAAESYSFFDLLQLKKLRDLRAKRVRSAVIRDSLRAMQQQVAGMENPLLEAGTFATKSRVAFRHHGAAVEPLAGQFVMDFAERSVVESRKVLALRTAESAADFFTRGVCLEEAPATQEEAIASYKKCVELDPTHAAAYINLGTLYYNRHDHLLAERYYRKAIEVDPKYALAISTWATCSTRLDASPTAFARIKAPSLWPPPMLTPTTIWHWPTRRLASLARPCATGRPMPNSIPWVRGLSTPGIRSRRSWPRTS